MLSNRENKQIRKKFTPGAIGGVGVGVGFIIMATRNQT